MPHNVEIEVFPIARTQVDRGQVRRWLDHLGATDFTIPSAESCTDPALLVALAAKRCYLSFQPGLNPNVSKVRQDLCDYLDNLLKSGHGSVLEHASWTFAIEGVSRIFTGEMNRHRAGWAISEGSMRFIRFKDIPWWLPLSLREQDDDSPEIKDKKRKSRALFREAFERQELYYQALVELWDMEEAGKAFSEKKKLTSSFRRLIGMGVATGGTWTGNLRALRHVIALRTEPAAEEEIAHVFGKIAEIMLREEPFVFADFEKQSDGAWEPEYPKV